MLQSRVIFEKESGDILGVQFFSATTKISYLARLSSTAWKEFQSNLEKGLDAFLVMDEDNADIDLVGNNQASISSDSGVVRLHASRYGGGSDVEFELTVSVEESLPCLRELVKQLHEEND